MNTTTRSAMVFKNTEIVPRTMNCRNTCPRPATMNCGMNDKKKSAVLGFSASVRMPCRKEPCAGAAVCAGISAGIDLSLALIEEELAKIRETVGAEAYADGRWDQARSVFEQVALADDFVDFLTLPAYELID